MRRRSRLGLWLTAAAVVLACLLRPTLAPATVEEQRRRLPPPAQDCQDPVTGFWMGHQVTRGTWYRFTLDVRRVEPGGSELTGSIESLYWDVDAPEPPPCEGNNHDQLLIDMPAKGRFEDGRIEFTGQSWTLRKTLCGSMFGSYAPDSFAGRLIEENTEFHTENDDGYNPITTVVFRRIKCGDDNLPVPELPPPDPEAYGPSGCGGCGGCF